MIQNTLLGQLYTTLHNYAQDHGFPSPPPEMPEIIAVFESDFTSLRLEAESGIQMLARGKAIHQPMNLEGSGKSYSGMNLRNNAGNAIASRRGNGNQITKPGQPAIMPAPPSPEPREEERPDLPHLYSDMKPRHDLRGGWQRPDPNALSPQTSYAGANPSPPQSVASSNQNEYYPPSQQIANMKPRPSITSMASSTSIASSIAAKKKKPPPPPPKRLPSQQFEYVTALYDFNGQNQGDLSFREGDRIKIIKKTPSDQDWWDGELRGVKGAFPANYCRSG
jgi:amphiphysin